MKKRILMLLAVITLSVGLCACSKSAENKADEESIDEETMEDESSGSENKYSKKKKKDKEPQKEEYDDSKAKDAYMSFLSDRSNAISDIDVTNILSKDGSYTFSDIIESTKKYEQGEYFSDDEIALTDALYAYIDCGNDGTTEMAVTLQYDLYNNICYTYFFRYEDGQVYLMGQDSWGGRIELSVNKAGYVVNHGSGGAALYVWDCYYFNAAGERVFLYTEEEVMNLSEPKVPYYYMKDWDIRSDYPADDYAERGYYVDILRFDEFEFDENATDDDYYDRYYSKQIYHATDDYGDDAVPSEEYLKLYKKEGIRWVDTYDEYNSIREDHVKELGASDDIIYADDAEWESIVDLGIMNYPIREIAEIDETEVPTVYIYDDLPKPYASDEAVTPSGFVDIKLTEKSCTANDIIDIDEWFEKAGTAHAGTYFGDGIYNYELTGDMGYGNMSVVNVYDTDDYSLLYSFDFSDFEYEDGYEGNAFVNRGIKHCFITGDYLYASLFHNTYADSCPENGYLICVDINTGEVVWISDPLVCNSDNFIRWGDHILCGYGFTDEADYLYVVNRYTGAVEDRIKLKKSPDYLQFVDDDLWVRTYSYDYVFTIEE